VASYENKILLAAEAAIFTSKFVLKLEENIILCAISLWTSVVEEEQEQEQERPTNAYIV
jgi:hypothetical protein